MSLSHQYSWRSPTLLTVVFRNLNTPAILNSMADSPTNKSTDFDSVTWMSLGSTPATRRYKERPCHINPHEITIYSWGGPGKAKMTCCRSQDSMADSSTTATPILNLLAGRHWAQRQLHAGIMYASVASILMKSLYTLGGGGSVRINRECWRSQDSMADASTTMKPILEPSPGRH